ncbi:MAG: isoprenyl transferase [Acetanaerobacterium sp.]
MLQELIIISQITNRLAAENALPAHIGIIMDGNGRWAKKRGLPRQAGHQYGATAFKNIADYCAKIGIRYLTVYAFSTENWKRPQTEVDAIMDLLRRYLDELLDDQSMRGRFKTMFIGDRSTLAPDLVERIERAEGLSQDCEGICVCIALNYGGRTEIVRAVKEASRQVAGGRLAPEEITEEYFSSLLDTAGLPDPDLIIRPSGEHRTSNFMIWQSAYAEYVFTDVLWPDFKKSHLDAALMEYARRSRRFGGV